VADLASDTAGLDARAVFREREEQRMSETTGPTVKPRRGSRQGREYRPRLRGEEREEMRKTLAKKYDAGASIRELATEHSLSYGLTRHLLVEAGVTLRGRSGQRKARG
jgi:hypothetical protein